MLRVNINDKILLRGVGALAVTISRSFCHYPAHPVAPHPISILPCPHFLGKLGDLPPPPSSLPLLPAPFVTDVTNSGCLPRLSPSHLASFVTVVTNSIRSSSLSIAVFASQVLSFRSDEPFGLSSLVLYFIIGITRDLVGAVNQFFNHNHP